MLSGLFNFIFIVWNEGLPWGIACWEKICSVLILSQLLSLTSYFRGKFQEGRFFFGKGMFIQCTSPMANYMCERFFWHGVNVFSNMYYYCHGMFGIVFCSVLQLLDCSPAFCHLCAAMAVRTPQKRRPAEEHALFSSQKVAWMAFDCLLHVVGLC